MLNVCSSRSGNKLCFLLVILPRVEPAMRPGVWLALSLLPPPSSMTASRAGIWLCSHVAVPLYPQPLVRTCAARYHYTLYHSMGFTRFGDQDVNALSQAQTVQALPRHLARSHTLHYCCCPSVFPALQVPKHGCGMSPWISAIGRASPALVQMKIY